MKNVAQKPLLRKSEKKGPDVMKPLLRHSIVGIVEKSKNARNLIGYCFFNGL